MLDPEDDQRFSNEEEKALEKLLHNKELDELLLKELEDVYENASLKSNRDNSEDSYPESLIEKDILEYLKFELGLNVSKIFKTINETVSKELRKRQLQTSKNIDSELNHVFDRMNKCVAELSTNYPFSMFGDDEISEIKATNRREDLEFLDNSNPFPTMSPERGLANKLSERADISSHNHQHGASDISTKSKY